MKEKVIGKVWETSPWKWSVLEHDCVKKTSKFVTILNDSGREWRYRWKSRYGTFWESKDAAVKYLEGRLKDSRLQYEEGVAALLELREEMDRGAGV